MLQKKGSSLSPDVFSPMSPRLKRELYNSNPQNKTIIWEMYIKAKCNFLASFCLLATLKADCGVRGSFSPWVYNLSVFAVHVQSTFTCCSFFSFWAGENLRTIECWICKKSRTDCNEINHEFWKHTLGHTERLSEVDEETIISECSTERLIQFNPNSNSQIIFKLHEHF